jgi:TetR/AcrR family transcriptional repressor of nem operon
MARPREFDENEVLEKAMMCFWKKGYEGASVSELEKATGISRVSLYNTFKDKEQLFITVQKKYHGVAKEYLEHTLNEDATLDHLKDFFSMIGSKITDGSSPVQFGCMMVNTVLNVDSISQNVVDNVKTYREMMVGQFRGFLEHMKGKGEIRADVDVDDAAAYLLGSMWGALAVNRLYGDPTYTQPQINMVLNSINGWQVDKP